MKIAICDDEQEFRNIICRYLVEYQKRNHISFQIIEAENGEQLLNMFDGSVDVFFMDIKMQKLNGLETARQLRKKEEDLQIVFLTSAAEYALEGYKVDAFDYLVKPISKIQFFQLMNKIIERFRQKSDYIIARNYDEMHKILLSSILYIETMERNLQIHTLFGNVISHERLKTYEDILSKKGFFRCNYGYLVNLAFVESMRGKENILCLTNGEQIPVSRPRKKECCRVLSIYWGENL